MIRGISRRIILVDSPDPKLFENAIFILRNEAFDKGNAAEDVLRQAQNIADEYMKLNIEKKHRAIPPVAYALIGALCAGAVMVALYFLL